MALAISPDGKKKTIFRLEKKKQYLPQKKKSYLINKSKQKHRL